MLSDSSLLRRCGAVNTAADLGEVFAFSVDGDGTEEIP
jgi:hypothetical protein